MKNQKIENDIDGLIILNKEKNFTSYDCLAYIKKILKTSKIGHTGTLDKNAEGVLVCLLGNATRSQEYLMKNGNKIYEAELIVGVATDTEDITGNIINTNTDILNDKKIIDEIIKSAKSFIGLYNQIPPMYSAKKINGKKLLNIARNGKSIDRKACEVNIENIDISYVGPIKYNDTDVIKFKLNVVCSKGTYIRTLCKDIGEKINLPSCMGDLKRLKNGIFDIKDSVKLSEIAKKVENNNFDFIKPCFYSCEETAVTFGKFETLHIGHKKILDTLVDNAREHNLKSVVMIVGENTDSVVLTKEQRISKLKYFGVDKIANYKLTYNNLFLKAEDFVKEVLINQLQAKIIVVGTDCSYGYKGEGNCEMLNKICEEYNVKVIVVDKLKVDNSNVDISSTFIKEEVKNGNAESVRKFLS